MTTITRPHRINSTIIENLNYDPDSEKLIVSFKGATKKHLYSNVSEELFEEILAAPSLGGILTLKIFTNPDFKNYKVIK